MTAYLPWAVLAAVNLPIFIVLGKWIFGDFRGFLDAIYFWFKPDLWSFFQGQLGEDWWAELKLGFFISVCGGTLAAEYHFIVAPFILGR